MQPQTARQPTLFIPHGAGPCFFMDWNPPHAWDKMADFLKGVAQTLPAKPKAILLISAHWKSPCLSVTGASKPELIYDYYGFPDHTYELTYPAPGEPKLAQRLADLLTQHNLPTQVNAQRGFDHGMFIPLKLMFPNADIPVVQLALHSSLEPELHTAIGNALTSLRDEGILIMGSGMSFHNMRGYGDKRFGPISDEFDAWLTGAIAKPIEQRTALLNRWFDGPQALLCHPINEEEHLIPLLVAAGAGGNAGGKKIFSDRVLETTLSAYRFD